MNDANILTRRIVRLEAKLKDAKTEADDGGHR